MSGLFSWISRLLGGLWGRSAASFAGLALTRGLDEPINDATAYGVGIEEAQPEFGKVYWKARRVHHLTPEENNFRQHIFLDIVDEEGNRLQGGRVRVRWPGGEQIVTLDKPPGEPAGNFPMWKYQVCEVEALGMSGEALPSDKVTGLHTSHKDEGQGDALGNRLFHHSFAIAFQRAVAGADEGERESAISGSVANGAGRTVLLEQAGAAVTQTVVGADEIYRLTGLTAGEYVVTVAGSDVRSAPTRVDGRSSAVVNLTVPPAPQNQSSVSGRVPRGAGVTVELHMGAALASWASVASDDRYLITALPAGRYRLGVAGTAILSEEFELDGRNSRLQDLELPEADNGSVKPLAHYVLFAPLSTAQGQVDWLMATPYLQTFGLTAGAHVEHAKMAARVTLIGGGPDAPGAAVEQALVAAGCRVERIEGESEDIAAELTRRIQFGQP